MAKRIVVGVEIDTNQAQASIEALNNKLVELNENVEENAADIEKVNDELKKLGKTGKKATKDMEGGFKGLSKSVGNFLKSLGIVALVVSAFNQLKEALTRNQKTADLLSTAGTALEIVFDKIVQNGIIPLVEGFEALFEDPQKSIKEFGDAVKENLIERFESFLETLGFLAQGVKDLFTGDFDAALESFKNAGEEAFDVLTGVDGSLEKVVEGTKEFVAETLKLAQAQTTFNKQAELAEIQRQQAQLAFQQAAEEQRQIRDDEARSIAERIEANKELGRILEEQAEVESVFAQQQLDAANANLARNQGNVALINAVGEAELALAEIQERIVSQRSEQLTNNVALRKEGVQVILDEIDAETELTNVSEEEASKRLENQIAAADEKLIALEEAGLAENELFALQLQEKALLEAEYTVALGEESDKRAAEELKNQEKVKKARQATVDAALTAAQGFASAAQSLSDVIFENQLANAKGNAEEEEKIREKAFKANKAIGIVNAIISTAQAVISGFNAGASLGPAGVVMGPVMAALAGVTGAIQIAAIASSQYQPSGGGAAGARPSTPTAPSVPSAGSVVGPNVNFAGSGNNLNTVGGGASETIPVVIENTVSVSETEITGTQATVSELESNAELSE